MDSDPLLSVAAIAQWGEDSGISQLMRSRWGWPIAEVLHFTGLCLLFGTIGFLDLRLLGIGRGIPLQVLRRLTPFGVTGFAISVATGLMFLVSAPDQYIYNPAVQTKLALIAVAGVNMVLFHAFAAHGAWRTCAGGQAPAMARIFGAISLVSWLGVIACGRVITAYRPPFHWCLWC